MKKHFLKDQPDIEATKIGKSKIINSNSNFIININEDSSFNDNNYSQPKTQFNENKIQMASVNLFNQSFSYDEFTN